MTYQRRYNPNRSPDWNYGGAKWKLSRSKIDLFIECPQCFYLDNKLGTKRPNIPSFNLNIAVDELFKKEFDVYRTNKTPHPIMADGGVDAIPFAHSELNNWRDPFVGIMHQHPETNLLVSGGVDDIWVAPNDELIVVDYKATSKEGTIANLDDSAWKAQYERQIGVYQWLLQQNDFKVSNTGYFVYANASIDADQFADTLHFETTLIPCHGKTDWIEPKLKEIKACLDDVMYPASSPDCEYCAYRAACGQKLLTIKRAHG